MLRKSISTLLFVMIAVTFILPTVNVVRDADAAASHYRYTTYYHEIYTKTGEFCEVKYVGDKTEEQHHPGHEGISRHYRVLFKRVEVDKCDDDDGNDDDSDETTT